MRAPRVAALVAVLGVLVLAPPQPARAQTDPLDRFSSRNIAESLLALNAAATAPGLESLHLKVDPSSTGARLRYDRWGIEAPIAVDTPLDWLKVHIDLGFGVLLGDERFVTPDGSGGIIDVANDRTVTSGRFGVGPGIEPFEGIYVATYAATAISKIASKSATDPESAVIPGLTPQQQELFDDWSTHAWSVAAVVDAQARRWLRERRHRIDARVQYALVYSETFNEDLALLQTSGLTSTLTGELVFRTITDVHVGGRRLAWNLFSTAGGFPGRELDDFGATYTFGFGVGIDLYFPEEILGMLRRNFVGVRGGGLVGNHNRGWSVVMQLQR